MLRAVEHIFPLSPQLYQHYLDKWTPHTASRWVFTLVLIAGFMLRIMLRQGWYIVCYALGIYHLNLFLAFLTPKIDPAFSQDDGEAVLCLITSHLLCFIRLCVALNTFHHLICFISWYCVWLPWFIYYIFTLLTQ